MNLTLRFLTAVLVAGAFVSSVATASFEGHKKAAEKADRSATLTRLADSYPKTLNPVIYSSAVEANIISDYTIFESLVTTDPDTGEPVCWLCKSYEYESGNKKNLTLKLRKGLEFHDGKALTSEDVKFSYEVMIHPKVDNLRWKSRIMAAINSIEAADERTVKVEFKKERYANIYELGNLPIIPKHKFPYFDKSPEKFNKDQEFGRSPIGSGPYEFEKWEAGKFVELKRNDDWWGFEKGNEFAGAFNFETIRYKIITNDNVALQAFKKGEIDFMGLQSFQYDELREGEGEGVSAIHLEPKVGTSFMFIGWNSRLPKFADVKTRHALALLTNRKKTLEKFSRGLRPPTNGPWGIDSPYQCPPKKCPVVPFDTKKARKLLKEAGWGNSDGDRCLDRKVDGKKQVLKFTVLGNQSDWTKNVLNVYANEMKKSGVCADIRLLDWTAMTKLIDDLKFEAYISGFRSGFPILPRQLFHSENAGKGGSNSWGYEDEKTDELIEKFEKEFDKQKRIQLGRKLHKRIYEAHPMVWHHEGGGCFVGAQENLEGVTVADYKPSCIYWPRWYKPEEKEKKNSKS